MRLIRFHVRRGFSDILMPGQKHGETAIMIAGIGMDIVEVARIRRAIDRHGERFLDRIFTATEMDYSRARLRCFEHLSARFAAKEAVLKALGTGMSEGARLGEVEVVNKPTGQPEVVLHGKTQQLFAERGIDRIFLSLSHTEALAIAQVVIESRDRVAPATPADSG